MLRRSTLVCLALSTCLAGPAFAQSAGAKNVILMISDGIGFNGWLAADYYEGKAGTQSYQTARPDGTAPVVLGQTHWALNMIDPTGRVLADDSPLEQAAGAVEQGYDPTTRWSQFERTFRNDFGPVGIPYTSYTDSSSAATALYTGRKTVNGRVNKDWNAANDLRTIAQIADVQGRATGAVSTVQASHATPAAVWSHNVSRGNMAEIFNEMVASGLDVIMGAGHPEFDVSGRPVEPAADDPEAFEYVGGAETWGALTGRGGLNGFAFIDEKGEFEALARGENLPEKVVGIVQANRTTQADREGLPAADTLSGMAFVENVPSLETMTLAALNVLNQNPNGFFLMSEGGAVDWMGHANDMPRFIEEQVDFNRAVDAAIAWIETNSSWDETLLIVTSDHETGGVWGEGTWTNGTGGPVAESVADEAAVEAARFHPAEDVFNEFLAVQDRGAGNLPGFQWASGNHTNEMVPLWAFGAGAERFIEHARHDQGAAALWGEPYGWDGRYVDNTAVFHVMNEAFAEDHARRTLSQ